MVQPNGHKETTTYRVPSQTQKQTLHSIPGALVPSWALSLFSASINTIAHLTFNIINYFITLISLITLVCFELPVNRNHTVWTLLSGFFPSCYVLRDITSCFMLSVISSFSLLWSFSLTDCTIICLSFILLKDIWIVSSFEPWLKAFVTMLVLAFWDIRVYTLWAYT